MRLIILSVVLSTLFPFMAFAGVCDYKPSHLVGGKATTSIVSGSGGVAAAGIGMKSAGFYAISNATTGAAMLGSTASGVSAAGTVGIIGGTSGVLGSIGAVVMSPFILIPAAVVTVGIGVYEGGCYLAK